jgi:hypothetical protein
MNVMHGTRHKTNLRTYDIYRTWRTDWTYDYFVMSLSCYWENWYRQKNLLILRSLYSYVNKS